MLLLLARSAYRDIAGDVIFRSVVPKARKGLVESFYNLKFVDF